MIDAALTVCMATGGMTPDDFITVHQLEQVKASVSNSCRQIRLSVQSKAAGRFEWVDGALLRAVECGEWVVLDNANFCNPTVCEHLPHIDELALNILLILDTHLIDSHNSYLLVGATVCVYFHLHA